MNKINIRRPLNRIEERLPASWKPKIEKLDKGLEGFEKFKTKEGIQIRQYESRDYCVRKIPAKHLTVLARSKYGIEMLKHNSKRVLGVQFHPELSGSCNLQELMQLALT